MEKHPKTPVLFDGNVLSFIKYVENNQSCM